MRAEAGRRIDPATAEITFCWGQTSDPCGDDPDLPEEYRAIGRNYFAREPGSDIWISFHDLPEATIKALWQRIEREGLNPGINDLITDYVNRRFQNMPADAEAFGHGAPSD